MEAIGHTTDAEPPDQTTSPIFKLPAEIRNRIYELVLYHSENEGYIKPATIVHRGIAGMKGVLSAVIRGELQNVVVLNTVRAAMRHEPMKHLSDFATEDREARIMFDKRRAIEIEEENREDGMPLTEHFSALAIGYKLELAFDFWREYSVRGTRRHKLDLKGHIDSGGRFADLIVERTVPDADRRLCPTNKFFICEHFCTKQCVAQPPLTRVSRQIREETLTVFYGVNKFVIERHCNRYNQGQVDAWPRFIGDANLRLMRDVYIFQPSRGIRFYRAQGQNVIAFRRAGDGEYRALDDESENGDRKVSTVFLGPYLITNEPWQVPEDRCDLNGRRVSYVPGWPYLMPHGPEEVKKYVANIKKDGLSAKAIRTLCYIV